MASLDIYAPPVSSPSYPTKILTTSTTITNYTTTTSLAPYPTPDIIGAIEGLAPCSQTIVFSSLANSKCNPADLPCICTELKTSSLGALITAKCSAADAAQYARFEEDVCRGVLPPPQRSSSSVVVTVTQSSALTVATPLPVWNSTTTVTTPASGGNGSTAVVSSGSTTRVVQGTATDGYGVPTTVKTVVPVGPSVSVESPPEYTGGAATMKMGALAGAVGFLGLVFAGL
ncbi:hypothetical protein BDU57DRAFT_544792 [Ampelomyces quisqualis]|uniref:Uncharacterized protein n=1 Tax=Ampelomyces quisqualis TaxID=50730 RepID=A0A6A5R5Q4_AMPQU|nr:hypothetical protein BDU57DRAFT_544792 [Ampelomyces quisqualis]